MFSAFIFFFPWYILVRGCAVTRLGIARSTLVINELSALFHKKECFSVRCQRCIVSIVIYLKESARNCTWKCLVKRKNIMKGSAHMYNPQLVIL